MYWVTLVFFRFIDAKLSSDKRFTPTSKRETSLNQKLCNGYITKTTQSLMYLKITDAQYIYFLCISLLTLVKVLQLT